MAKNIDLDGVVSERLREGGQRYTDVRRSLIQALDLADGPVGIDRLQRSARIPLSTAYRNLAILESVGVVRRIELGSDSAAYELAESISDHHHHAVCVNCGKVLDFDLSPADEAALEAMSKRAAKKLGFVADEHRLDLIGRCSDCA